MDHPDISLVDRSRAVLPGHPGEPLGLDRRRVIVCEGLKVVGLDDEILSKKGR
ncbi:hypothetical protein AB0H83_32880 [Dactylosporangium sp. NPDC050688]|uniref:hypothetical protein n=1 Tax=Dactylosporangium sp. NPDC050688 TaxID=3157217 RepID=UPI0033FB921D